MLYGNFHLIVKLTREFSNNVESLSRQQDPLFVADAGCFLVMDSNCNGEIVFHTRTLLFVSHLDELNI